MPSSGTPNFVIAHTCIHNSRFYTKSNVRYSCNEYNATVYPAYIDIISYHECMFFVCEILYINVNIQTENKKLKHNFVIAYRLLYHTCTYTLF